MEQAPWLLTPRRTASTTLVGVRVGANEVALRPVKQDRGQWLPSPCLELPYSRAKALGLEDRIEKRHMSNSRHLKDVYYWIFVGV